MASSLNRCSRCGAVSTEPRDGCPDCPETPILSELWTAPGDLPAVEAPARPPSRVWLFLKKTVNFLFPLAGLAGAAFGVWSLRQQTRPEIVVSKLAAEHLDALRTLDFGRAYRMLTPAARRSFTEAEFRAYQGATPWAWTALRVVRQEPGAIVFAYDLLMRGRPARVDHLLFTLEGGAWGRPYDGLLIRRAEQALAKGDVEKGLDWAQAAGTVNPRDPLAWGYLCEAAFYRKTPVDAAARCEKALELARVYPSDLTPKGRYHLHAVLADIYLHALHRHDLALAHFARMLGFPDLSPVDQCQIALARAQLYIKISRPGEALAELDRGERVCASPADRKTSASLRLAMNAPR